MTKATESKRLEKLDKKLWPAIDKKKLWPLAKIKPYDKNARTHPPAQVTLLAQLIRKYGPDQDIVVDEEGVILKGHGRRLAAIEAELTEFPVIQRLGLSKADKIAMRIADNQVALLAGWDEGLIRMEMHVLKSDDYPLEMLGFGKTQLVTFTTAPGPPAGGFASFGEDIETSHTCPKCGYSWSGPAKGAPKPAPEKKPAAKKPAARRKARG